MGRLENSDDPQRFVEAIRKSGFTIYTPIKIGDPNYWIPAPDLEALLDKALRGISLKGFTNRTRSKVMKEHICEALGYPLPLRFTKTRPRFPGQAFDTYGQKHNNLQVWNEGLSPARRYVLVRIDSEDKISKVKVVTGAALAPLDTTGTLTQKYQASFIPGPVSAELVSPEDTDLLRPFVVSETQLSDVAGPLEYPAKGEILSVAAIFERLKPLVGQTLKDTSSDRNRGAALHRLVCEVLGYSSYQDDGEFPDVRHQLLEVKLQTSRTIDLGLIRPASTDALDLPMIEGKNIRPCDTRYAIFYGAADGVKVALTHILVTTGERFFDRLPQFGGKVLNKKIQLHLPKGFFTG